MKITCRACAAPFPETSFPHLCPTCGGLFGFKDGLLFSPELLESQLPGIWRYRSTFGLPDSAPLVTLGEGDTPLVWSEISGRRAAFKLEGSNPTGSFKDRATAVLVSWLLAAGVDQAVEDSSGNAGASFAAYASSAGIRAKVFVPAYASGPKRRQIESYGAEVIAVPGSRIKAAEAVLDAAGRGAVYASHAYLPQGTAGIATIAYELVQQLGECPGSVIMPVGHGSLLLGIALGFEALQRADLISRLPMLIGVQSAACAPLYRAYQQGSSLPATVEQGKTAAEGVAIANPYHGQEVLKAVARSGGFLLQVSEQEIQTGRKQLAANGFYVEPTSALVWKGLEQVGSDVPEPAVLILTGHGLKSD